MLDMQNKTMFHPQLVTDQDLHSLYETTELCRLSRATMSSKSSGLRQTHHRILAFFLPQVEILPVLAAGDVGFCGDKLRGLF